MVFTELSTQEKDAFFGLLDEYFQSRPEPFAKHGGGQGVSRQVAGTGIPTAAATSALAANTASSPNGGGASTPSSFQSTNSYTAPIATPNSADVACAVSVGRVGGFSLAFSRAGARGPGTGPHSPSPSPSSLPMASVPTLSQPSASKKALSDGGGGPPTLPRRAAFNTPVHTAPTTTGTPEAQVDLKLVLRKANVLNAFKKTPAVMVRIPPAFTAPRNTYGPPPVRRATSTLPVPGEKVEEGEWAEVLYDYHSSEDPGDLAIEAGTRVFVTAKSSEDWWSGQVEGQGREGLFPASYVKLL